MKLDIKKHIKQGNFGLEKESIRVDAFGYGTQTKHPFKNNAKMERDFCENQTELITGVCKSVDEVFEEMSQLQRNATQILQNLKTGTELLWPFSNPPYIGEEEQIPVARYDKSMKGKERYREYLAEKYGKKKMLFSGIHYNFSFSEQLLLEEYENTKQELSYEVYKNDLYLDLAAKVTKYSWLFVYLTAASPIMDGSFFYDEMAGVDVFTGYASPRCGDGGYWNQFVPVLDFSSVDSYVESIHHYIEDGKLKSSSELYYPVRLKPKGSNDEARLQQYGVNHIELRMFDLNPFSKAGVIKEDLKFIHLFLLYLASKKKGEFGAIEQIIAIQNAKEAAKYDDNEIEIHMTSKIKKPIKDCAMKVLNKMAEFYEKLDIKDAEGIIDYQKDKIMILGNRYAQRVKREFGHDYVKRGYEAAKGYARDFSFFTRGDTGSNYGV
ncbi:MAG: hypothetical protein ACOX1S_07415 [Anaerostipes sp.]|jgi:glutamate--cysteine ligase|nr:hypothetical protein [Anaerostipes sp.]